MPKRNTRTSRSSRRGKNQSYASKAGEITYTGAAALTINATTTAAALTLDSLVTQGSSSFLSGLGDLFQEYRFEKLNLTMYPAATSVAGSTIGVGYQNEITDGSPTSIGQIVALPWNQLMTDTMTVPSRFNVPRKALMLNMQKFWRTQLPSQTNTGTGTFASSNLWESVQGIFWFIASIAMTCTAVLRYTIRLVNPVAAGFSPAPRRRTESVLGWIPLSLADNTTVVLHVPERKHQEEERGTEPPHSSRTHLHNCGEGPTPPWRARF